MKKFWIFLIFTFAFLLAIITRGYKLGSVPSGLYLDEAGQGYSAYSILQTGKDEFGKPFPFVFRSFTDFKTPVYIYLIVPLIPLFGLTAETVRLPSFIFSILTLPILYFLIKELVGKKKYANSLALLSCILLAISPWHILFGRTNFECNVALFFFLSGVLTFYKALNKNPKLFILSAILFAIAIPAYHAQRIVTPLFLIINFIRFRKKLLAAKLRNYIFIGCALALLILLPTILISFTPGFLSRASGLNIFSYENHKPYGYYDIVSTVPQMIANNRIFLTVREFLSLYVSYFSPKNMFVLGDYGLRSSFPSLATFFVWQFPFYIIGVWFLVKKKEYGELRIFTLIMLLISPLPGAVTRDPYTSIRALQMVIPQTIICALGMIEIYTYLSLRFSKRNLLFLYILTLSLLILYSLFKLYSSVFILNEYYRAGEWNYGWQETVTVLKTLNPDIPVVVDTARGEAYIQIAFFTKYPPQKYSEDNFEVTTDEYYYNMNRRGSWVIGNIFVQPLKWEEVLRKEQYLVGDALAISNDQIRVHNLILIHDTLYPDGTIAQRIVKTNP